MEVRLNVRNLDLRETQEKVDNNLRQVRQFGYKTILAYAGLWGMAYDEAVSVLERGRSVLNQAGERGEALEAEANQRVQRVRKEAESQLREVEARVETLQDKLFNRVQRVEDKAEADVEVQIERVLNRLGIPSRERIAKLSTEIESLSRKIDQQLAAQKKSVVVVETDPMPQPLVSYDNLNAKEIIASLDAAKMDALMAIKLYEEAHENRITVLREVNRRLDAMPFADYDQLTVEEIETKLADMNNEQLAFLARYEAFHENRVTLLRSLEREQTVRAEPVFA